MQCFTESLDILMQGYELDPTNVELLQLLAEVFAENGEFDQLCVYYEMHALKAEGKLNVVCAVIW